MIWNWKNIARRLWREKRDAQKLANEMTEWTNRMLHRELDEAGVPTSTYYPGEWYDGSIARVAWVVAQLKAKPDDDRYVPKRDFDTALQVRDLYVKENRQLRARLAELEAVPSPSEVKT